MMTPQDRDRLASVVEAACPGPWYIAPIPGGDPRLVEVYGRDASLAKVRICVADHAHAIAIVGLRNAAKLLLDDPMPLHLEMPGEVAADPLLQRYDDATKALVAAKTEPQRAAAQLEREEATRAIQARG